MSRSTLNIQIENDPCRDTGTEETQRGREKFLKKVLHRLVNEKGFMISSTGIEHQEDYVNLSFNFKHPAWKGTPPTLRMCYRVTDEFRTMAFQSRNILTSMVCRAFRKRVTEFESFLLIRQ